MGKKVAMAARVVKQDAEARATPEDTSRRAPVTDETRSVPAWTRLLLSVRAGGRCEFPSCNQLLFEHHVTLTEGNFGQVAHVVAFSPAGPRGGDAARPQGIHDIGNLLLLCPRCHKLIDDHPDKYPRNLLASFKTEHEDRIRYVTGFPPDQRTHVVQLKVRIGGDAVDIPFPAVARAVAPRYPADAKGHVIDITALHGEEVSLEPARQEVDRVVDRLFAPSMDAEKVQHISVFALAPIPVLVYLGARLSNKIPVDLYQLHRDTKEWVWKTDGDPVEYELRTVHAGNDPANVALVLSLSGAISPERLPPLIDGTFTVYELGLAGRQPSTDFLRRRDDLTRFESIYRDLLARIVRDHPRAAEIHLFPAVPAPIAVACGHHLLPKAQPPLLVYDYVAARGGFIPRLRTDA